MTVKTCKKHGELEEKDTYLMKKKCGTMIRMCSICKRGYRTDWDKRNPEKVKLRQEKNRKKRIQDLNIGVIKKNCKKHGDLPIDEIRVDSRGSTICKKCHNEVKRKSKKKVDPDNERYRKWLYSDMERVYRYRDNDYEKRKIRQRKSYHRNKVRKDWIQHRLEIQRKNALVKRNELSDTYIRTLIKTFRYGGIKNRYYKYFSGMNVSPDVIELKRSMIKLKRKIRENK